MKKKLEYHRFNCRKIKEKVKTWDLNLGSLKILLNS